MARGASEAGFVSRRGLVLALALVAALLAWPDSPDAAPPTRAALVTSRLQLGPGVLDALRDAAPVTARLEVRRGAGIVTEALDRARLAALRGARDAATLLLVLDADAERVEVFTLGRAAPLRPDALRGDLTLDRVEEWADAFRTGSKPAWLAPPPVVGTQLLVAPEGPPAWRPSAPSPAGWSARTPTGAPLLAPRVTTPDRTWWPARVVFEQRVELPLHAPGAALVVTLDGASGAVAELELDDGGRVALASGQGASRRAELGGAARGGLFRLTVELGPDGAPTALVEPSLRVLAPGE